MNNVLFAILLQPVSEKNNPANSGGVNLIDIYNRLLQSLRSFAMTGQERMSL